MAKWIITDHVHSLAKDLLLEMGKSVDWLPDISSVELADIIHQYEGMIISSKTKVDSDLVDKAVNLRIVGRVGSGMEHIDMDYCRSKNIICLNSPEGNCNAVAEHAFGMLLSLSKNIGKANNEIRSGTWLREENRGFEIRNRRIGIIGYGNTGSAFASKFKGWEAKVDIYDKYKSGYGAESGMDFLSEVDLDALVRECDVISFHIPYNVETHHWINREFINDCKAGVIIINTSRGAIANTKDVLEALKSGQIGGFCVDVFEDEPVTKNKINDVAVYIDLLDRQNVIASPHIAGWSRESKESMVRVLISKIGDTLNKQGVQ